jgi:ABC-type sugar transport system substrate-binding protein
MRIIFKSRTPLRTSAACAALALLSVGVGTSAASASVTVSNYKAPAANACAGKTLGEADTSTTISFLAAMDNAMVKEGARLGMKTTVLGANLDNTTEVYNIDDLIAKKVSAIAVTSSSQTAVLPAIKQSLSAGIPVFAVNAALASSAKVVTYDGDSDYQYGQAEGKLILKALPKGGKIAILEGPLGDTPTTDRLAGIKNVIGSHKDIKIVDTEVDNFDNPTALADTQDIVAEGPEIYVGANYAKSHGRHDIKFIGGDYPTQVAAAIKSGAVYGTVDQSPGLEGKLGADYACDYLLGKKNLIPGPKALVPLPTVTKANVNKIQAQWSD